MASYDPRIYPVHAAIHPSMMGNMGARFAPPSHSHHAPNPGHAPSPQGHGNAHSHRANVQQTAEATKKKAGAGWESTYRTAQRIALPDPQVACGERVGEFMEDIAKGIGCPVEYVVAPLLPCIGGLLGTNTSIQVHRGWCEPPVLWSVVGATTGSRRSAVIRQLLNPILCVQQQRLAMSKRGQGKEGKEDGDGAPSTDQRALYSGTRITLAALTEVLHRNDGHAFSLSENVETLHDMLGLLQPMPVPRLVSVLEDLYEGLPLVAVEEGRVTTILGSNFCHGGFASPEYMVTLLLKCPAWFSSRLLMSCPQADDMKGVFGEPNTDLHLPELEQVYSVLLDYHRAKAKYIFDSDAVQELSRFFDEEWSTVLNQLEQNEHEGIIGKSMGQIVRISGILKALDNALQHCNTDSDEDYEWDWTIDLATVKCAIVLGKYFLEQKLAMTFMVDTGFFNMAANNSIDKDNGSMNGGNLDMDYPDSPTTLPQTAFQENRSSGNSFQGGGGGGGGGDQAGVDGNHADSNGGSSGSITGNSHFANTDFPILSQAPSFHQSLPSMKPDAMSSPNPPPMPPSFLNTPPSQSSSAQGSRFGFAKKPGDVDYRNLPHMMTTAEEDMSEMIQAIDFVHFSRTQFVAVHGRRVKRLLECYDDGHGVSATTAAQKSITPPVRIEGTNNRHPAWASALFFQKVADLGLGIAEQGRHPTNRKVCWRFKRKPVAQLNEKDYQLLQYLRIEMDKYSQFGNAPFNPTLMINSGIISLTPTGNQGTSSSPLPPHMDDESSNSQESQGHGHRNPLSVNVKPEVF